jgi:hypothetical protein
VLSRAVSVEVKGGTRMMRALLASLTKHGLPRGQVEHANACMSSITIE